MIMIADEDRQQLIEALACVDNHPSVTKAKIKSVLLHIKQLMQETYCPPQIKEG